MAGSLSVATTAVSSAKVAVVDSGEIGRSAVYSRYNIGEFCVLTFTNQTATTIRGPAGKPDGI
jgi:hypothetical protein